MEDFLEEDCKRLHDNHRSNFKKKFLKIFQVESYKTSDLIKNR